MSNDELKERVEIMRMVGVKLCRDGETEIELFAPDLMPANDVDNDAEADRKKRERHTYGGK